MCPEELLGRPSRVQEGQRLPGRPRVLVFTFAASDSSSIAPRVIKYEERVDRRLSLLVTIAGRVG